ncbi:MAG: hypothetical protein FWD34_00540 [Oscillospiraceae bacterium]|nr:hypothetical protein [Oscillospiraceae bacterium]
MSVHEDTLQGLQEALEYAKGNLRVKTTVVEIPDEEIKFYSIYGKLSETNKIKIMEYANELLQA